MLPPHWLALLLKPDPEEGGTTEPLPALRALGWLALRFSPRVARLEEAVVLEVGASLRLFGGVRALHERLQEEAAQAGLTLQAPSWAPTSLGALALARSGIANGLRPGLASQLNALPLSALSAVVEHQAMLERLGCRCLADVRRLPRPALARRFGPALLDALDQAYGDAPEAHDWLRLPEQFESRLELPFRIEHAPTLLHHAQTLLRELCAWLAARHAGIRQLTLSWQHDAMRSRDSGAGGQLCIGTAETSRDFQHLSRLLGEHLAQTRLLAPAGELRLEVDTVLPLDEHSASLLPQSGEQANEPMHQLLERLSVRLGPQAVREGQLQEDHRLERMQRWLPWPAPAGPGASAARRPPGPQPSWLFDPPQRLSTTAQDRPLWGGALLQQVMGPQRIEGGWWNAGQPQQRDYFLFHSAELGLVWLYSERLPRDEGVGWFLHGVFA